MRTNRIVALMVVVGILCVFIAMFLPQQTSARWEAKDVKHCVETGYEAGWKAGAKNHEHHSDKCVINAVTGRFYYTDSYTEGIEVVLDGVTVEGVTHVDLYGEVE